MNQPKPSKTAKKREYLELQDLGVQLTTLTDEQLESIHIDEDLLRAVREARRMTSHGAVRRQRQLIGKLMRQTDPSPIRSALRDMGQQEQLSKQLFARAESWRDRIASEGSPALEAFAEEFSCDTSDLVSLSKDLAATGHEEGRKKIRRQIFRAVHEELNSKVQKNTG